MMMDESHALREHTERASNMGVRSQATLNSEALDVDGSRNHRKGNDYSRQVTQD